MATIDAYIPITKKWYKTDEDWKECPHCNHKPRVWIFDNGESAKCLCRHKWDAPPATAESILSHVKRHNGSCATYDTDNLRKAWNRYVETGEDQSDVNYEKDGTW